MKGGSRSVGSGLVLVASLVYLAVIAWLVLRPAPADEARAVESTVHNPRTAIAPFATGGGLRTGSDAVVLGPDDEEVSNVLLFVPLPVFARILCLGVGGCRAARLSAGASSLSSWWGSTTAPRRGPTFAGTALACALGPGASGSRRSSAP